MTTSHARHVKPLARTQKPYFKPLERSVVKVPITDSIADLISDIERNLRKSFQSSEEKPFVIDVESAIKILETAPHPKQELDEETQKWMKELFERLDAEEIPDDGPTDASENLDKYIYGFSSEEE